MTAPTLPPPDTRTRAGEGSRMSSLRGSARDRLLIALSTLRRAEAPARSSWLLGPVAALWAAAVGLAIAAVPVLLVWMATPDSGLTWLESLRVAGMLWAIAHGLPVVIGAVTYSLLPWGLAVIPLVLLAAAGRWAARTMRTDARRELALLVVSGAVAYALVVGVVAAMTRRPEGHVDPLDAVVHALVLGVLGLGFGAVRGAGLRLGALLPAAVALTLRAGLIATATLLGFGAIAVAGSLIARVDDAVTMTQSLHPGFWGGIALLLLGIAYVPVLVVWGTAYILGAGVLIGPAVAVSPFIASTAPTRLPPFPLLAALPQSAGPAAWALPLAGVIAGVIAGLLIATRSRAQTRLLRLVMAIGSAAVAGLLLWVLAYLSTGSLGDQRLVDLGPAPTTVAVLAFVLVTLGSVPTSVVTSPPSPPRLAPAEPRSDGTDQEDVDG